MLSRVHLLAYPVGSCILCFSVLIFLSSAVILTPLHLKTVSVGALGMESWP